MVNKDVARWLDSLGLARYGELFAENEIDWEVFPELTDSDLEKLGIPLGSRKKLLKGIANIDAGGAGSSPADPAGEEANP